MEHDNDKLLKELLNGNDLSPEDSTTLSAEDLECNDLLKTVKTVDTTDEPPAHLDTAIRAHAHSTVSQSKRPIVIYFRMALTAAAALLFTLIVIQLLPVKKDEPGRVVDKPGKGTVVKPDESKVVRNKVIPTLAKDESAPEFDWYDDSITKELALLEAEMFMDELDYADAALVENFE